MTAKPGPTTYNITHENVNRLCFRRVPNSGNLGRSRDLKNVRKKLQILFLILPSINLSSPLASNSPKMSITLRRLNFRDQENMKSNPQIWH